MNSESGTIWSPFWGEQSLTRWTMFWVSSHFQVHWMLGYQDQRRLWKWLRLKRWQPLPKSRFGAGKQCLQGRPNWILVGITSFQNLLTLASRRSLQRWPKQPLKVAWPFHPSSWDKIGTDFTSGWAVITKSSNCCWIVAFQIPESGLCRGRSSRRCSRLPRLCMKKG